MDKKLLVRSSFFQLGKVPLMASAWVSVSLSVNAGQKAHVGLSASEPLSTPSVQHIYAVGPRSPFGLYAVCLARPGPAHFGSSANPPTLFCHFRIACRTVSADQPLVALHTSHCRDRDPGAPSAACRLKIAFVCAKGFKSPVADEDDGECPSAGSGAGCRRTDPSARDNEIRRRLLFVILFRF